MSRGNAKIVGTRERVAQKLHFDDPRAQRARSHDVAPRCRAIIGSRHPRSQRLARFDEQVIERLPNQLALVATPDSVPAAGLASVTTR